MTHSTASDILVSPSSGRDAPPLSLLVFSDDWGRHPSSCQHLVSQLLKSYPTLWVNTIGTRSPRLDLMTLRRGWEKLKHWRGSHDEASLPNHLTVASPRMWPWMSSESGRKLNRWLLSRQLTPWVRAHRPIVSLTTIPIVADLMGRLECDRWIYYCVDDFSTWPGLEHSMLASMEKRLLDGVDAVIAASESLQERIRTLGRESHLLTHGVDLEHWRAGTSTPVAIDAPKPWVVFWGLVDPRLETPWLLELSQNLDKGTILLVGPTQSADPRLVAAPRMKLVPSVPYERLPFLAREASVLIMPYADLPVTRAMQPLKLKEYLATGLPVVCSPLPAVMEWAQSLDVAQSSNDFSRLVRERIASGLPESQRIDRSRLASESWTAKADDLDSVIQKVATECRRKEGGRHGGE